MRTSLFFVMGLALAAGCYSTPTPNCAFTCGTNNECPSGYACSTDDQVCHLMVGSTLAACDVVASIDASTAVDSGGAADAHPIAGYDGPPPIIFDAGPRPDAPINTPDAPVASTPDAKVTTPDAKPSVPDAPVQIDAPPPPVPDAGTPDA